MSHALQVHRLLEEDPYVFHYAAQIYTSYSFFPEQCKEFPELL